MRRLWRRLRPNKYTNFDWVAQFRRPRGARPVVEVTGDALWALAEGVVLALAESAVDGDSRHEAWLDYSLAVCNLKHGLYGEVSQDDLEYEVTKAWQALSPELDAMLRLSVPTARRLARSLCAALDIKPTEGTY